MPRSSAPPAAIATRSLASVVRANGQPPSTGPTTMSSGTKRSSKKTSLKRASPVISRRGRMSPGIDIRPLREITGEALFNEVFFDDLFVPDDMVVGPVDGGWPLARTTLANERVAMATGGALDKGMEHLLEVLDSRQDDGDLDPAEADRLGVLIVAAQVGALLDALIAQMAVGGHD